MAGTYSPEALRDVIWLSLVLSSGRLSVQEGVVVYNGARPGSGWHAHGYFVAGALRVRELRLVRVPIRKRRWKDATARGRPSCHSRPDDELPSVRSCTLVVVLALWSWLEAERGLLHAAPIVPGLDEAVSRRTVQRWMRTAQRQALHAQQAIRAAVIERSEPRPMEQLFESGLSPPDGVRRRWRGASSVAHLWTAFAMLLGAAIDLQIPVSVLLAEARRRWPTDDNQFSI